MTHVMRVMPLVSAAEAFRVLVREIRGKLVLQEA